MAKRETASLFAGFALVLVTAAGCTTGPVVPMPAPSGSISPEPGPGPGPGELIPGDGESWLVHGQNDYVDGSIPVCSDDDVLTAAQPEFFGLYLEQGPGMPDDWRPGDAYQVNGDGILLEFDTGDYTASRFDGDDYSGIGTAWETFGTFTYTRDAQGVISGGSGTGETRILHENGDVENLADTMTFTVVVADEPTWCAIAVE
jgi:hypothetical protein